ncbi:MAG TPA: DNA recombination protein RmuC [Aromatoleum sp.]|nr:DNA recombination protein RmuC [Aromatoleum sp.]
MESQSLGVILWLLAALGGVAVGALIVVFVLRGRRAEDIAAAIEQGRAEVRIELAAAVERARSLEQERGQTQAQFEALRAQAGDWRNALDVVRDERAQLAERASRVAPLEQQLAEALARIATLQREGADLRENLGRVNSQLAAELKAEREVLAAVRGELGAEKGVREQAEVLANRLNAELAEMTTRLDAERRQSEEKLALLTAARESLSDQFKSLANDILEEKAKRFTEQNQTNLGQLLDPLRQRLQEFQGKVEQVYVQEGKDRSALAEQVRQLMELNQSLSEDAKNLTRALKGSSKTQGNWGELILERVLEASGLRKGEEYDVQESHTRDDGTRAQPDVVIHLPEDRHLVVDAKVSLTAYEEYVTAEDEGERAAWIKRHLDSVRGHIKGLSDRNYQALYELKSLDFVLMFVPVEPAFMLAVTHDRELFMDAWQKNVLLVSPSTLLFVVRTVAHLWRQEAQNRNAQDIARRGAELYDKLVGFVEDLESLGGRLEQAQKAYHAAHNKLASGRGNVIRQAEMLKQLGVKPTKGLPAAMVEAAADAEALADRGTAAGGHTGEVVPIR